MDYAYSHVKGKYVCYIGDDDAIVSSNISSLLELLHSAEYDTISWNGPTYQWGIDLNPPRIIHEYPIHSTFNLVNPRALALKTLRLGGWKYYNLPGTYHSLINRSLLDQIKEENGRVFDSTQPDLYTSLAVSFRCSKLSAHLDYLIQWRSQINSGSSLQVMVINVKI